MSWRLPPTLRVGGQGVATKATDTITVGGNQARLDARTEFEILEPPPKGGWKLVVHRAVTGCRA